MTPLQRKIFEVINSSESGFHLALFEAEGLIDSLKRKNYVARQPRAYYESVHYYDKEKERLETWFFALKVFLAIMCVTVIPATFALFLQKTI